MCQWSVISVRVSKNSTNISKHLGAIHVSVSVSVMCVQCISVKNRYREQFSLTLMKVVCRLAIIPFPPHDLPHTLLPATLHSRASLQVSISQNQSQDCAYYTTNTHIYLQSISKWDLFQVWQEWSSTGKKGNIDGGFRKYFKTIFSMAPTTTYCKNWNFMKIIFNIILDWLESSSNKFPSLWKNQ